MSVTYDQVGVSQVSRERVFEQRPTRFVEALIDETLYYADPIITRMRLATKHNENYDPDFDYTQYLSESERDQAHVFARAVNKEHFDDIRIYVARAKERRESMARTTVGMGFVASALSPINLLTIPLGGPLKGPMLRTATRQALRGGAAIGATEATLGVVSSRIDPFFTTQEIVTNTAIGAGFGAAFGALSSVQQKRFRESIAAQSNALLRTLPEAEKVAQDYRPRDQRGDMGNLSDDDLQSIVDRLDRERADIQRRRDLGEDERFLIEDEARVAVEREQYGRELQYRQLESEGFNPRDMYRPSKGGDSLFIRMATNPMRRILGANLGIAANAIKKMTLDLAGDGGLQLEAHRMGIALSPSVHQSSSADFRTFASLHDSLQDDWRASTGAKGDFRNVDPENLARRFTRSGDDFESWLYEVNRKRVFNEDMTDAERRAAQRLDSWFESWEKRLIETNLIRTREHLLRELEDSRLEIESLEAQIQQRQARNQKTDELDTRLDQLRRRYAQTEADLQAPTVAQQAKYMPRYWNHAAIRANRDELEARIASWYESNPYTWVYIDVSKEGESPRMAWKKVKTDTSASARTRRARETVDQILGESADAKIDAVFAGTGRSGHAGYRGLDIPNEKVWEFIETDPLALTKFYTARTGPQVRFAEKFQGKSRKAVVKEMREIMDDANVPEQKQREVIRDFTVLYDRVVGAMIQNPEALNQKIAAGLRDLASFTYLGGAGISALADAGRIIAETELTTLARTARGMLDPVLRKANQRHVRAFGGALEMTLGSAGLRMVEDQNFNFLNNRTLDRAKTAFHNLNLLGPVTVMAKEVTGMSGTHMLIEMSQKLATGTADESMVAYLARHGIDRELAESIADAPWQVDSNTGLIMGNIDQWVGSYPVPKPNNERVRVIEAGDPDYIEKEGVAARYNSDTGELFFDRDRIEGEMFDRKAWLTPRKEGVDPITEVDFPTPRSFANFVMHHEIAHTRFSAESLGLEPKSAAYENAINQIALKEHRKSIQIQADVAARFRAALNTHVNNVVMAATAADKPIMMDGVVFVPERFGRLLGGKKDPRVSGYYRVENAFIGLPLQFFGYAMANVNKTVGLFMQNGVRNRALGIAAMMGMGYMISSIRTPETIWDQMSPQDKLGKAFDMSGVAALYSDLFYTTMQTSLAVGGPNLTGGFMSPRFPQKPNALDAITNITGAGTGWAADMMKAMGSFAMGEFGEGADQFINNLPASNLWFLKDDINQIGRYLSN